MAPKFAFVILACLLCFIAPPVVRCAEPPPDIKMTVEFHMEGTANPAPPYVLDNGNPAAYFQLILENVSAKPLMLGRWVVDGIHFEVIDEHGKTTDVRKMTPAPTAIAPPIALAPKQKTVVQIRYVYSGKEGRSNTLYNYQFEFPAAGKSREITMRAIMENHPTDPVQLKNLEKEGYWTGKVASEPYKVTLAGKVE